MLVCFPLLLTQGLHVATNVTSSFGGLMSHFCLTGCCWGIYFCREGMMGSSGCLVHGCGLWSPMTLLPCLGFQVPCSDLGAYYKPHTAALSTMEGSVVRQASAMPV